MAYVSKSAKELEKTWPNESGLTAKTQKQEGRTTNLIPQRGTLVLRKNRTGIQ